jgi:hypothetical protein
MGIISQPDRADGRRPSEQQRAVRPIVLLSGSKGVKAYANGTFIEKLGNSKNRNSLAVHSSKLLCHAGKTLCQCFQFLSINERQVVSDRMTFNFLAYFLNSIFCEFT